MCVCVCVCVCVCIYMYNIHKLCKVWRPWSVCIATHIRGEKTRNMQWCVSLVLIIRWHKFTHSHGKIEDVCNCEEWHLAVDWKRDTLICGLVLPQQVRKLHYRDKCAWHCSTVLSIIVCVCVCVCVCANVSVSVCACERECVYVWVCQFHTIIEYTQDTHLMITLAQCTGWKLQPRHFAHRWCKRDIVPHKLSLV